MENIKIDYNKIRESLEQTRSEDFKRNSIFISGICNPSNFEFCKDFWNEFTLKSSINIPELYDPIDQIDSINSNVEIVNSKVIETPTIPQREAHIKNFENKLTTGRNLIITGFLCLTINYISICKNKSIQNFNVRIPFSNFIVLSKTILINENATDPLNIEFIPSACLENINIIEINSKNIKFSMNIFLTACSSDCIKNNKSSCNISPEIYGLCNRQMLDNLLLSDLNSINYWNQLSLSKIFTLPLDKPDIVQILSINSKFKVINQRVVNTPESTKNNLSNLSITGKKLIINALLFQKVDYISKTESQDVVSVDIIIPMSSYIVLPKTDSCHTKFNICLCLENIDLFALNNRQIFSSSTVFLKARPKLCHNIF